MKESASFKRFSANVWILSLCMVFALRLTCAQTAASANIASKPTQLIDVTVSEGASMSVAVFPDGKTLAIDMQGSI
jgi:hypothetical protein